MGKALNKHLEGVQPLFDRWGPLSVASAGRDADSFTRNDDGEVEALVRVLESDR